MKNKYKVLIGGITVIMLGSICSNKVKASEQIYYDNNEDTSFTIENITEDEVIEDLDLVLDEKVEGYVKVNELNTNQYKYTGGRKKGKVRVSGYLCQYSISVYNNYTQLFAESRVCNGQGMDAYMDEIFTTLRGDYKGGGGDYAQTGPKVAPIVIAKGVGLRCDNIPSYPKKTFISAHATHRFVKNGETVDRETYWKK